MGRLQLSGSDGAASTVITVDTRDAINYALMHHRVPLISAVEVTNSDGQASAGQSLELTLDPIVPGSELAEPLRIDIPALQPGETFSAPRSALDWPMSLPTLLNLDAPAQTRLRAGTAASDGEAAALPLDVLPADSWWSEGIRESLAGFVRPQDEAVGQLLEEVADVLEHHTGSAEIAGYQSGPGRVRQIVRGVYHVLSGLQLIRTGSSADMLAGGHSIRPPTQVLNSGRASALELVTVFAAVLEYAGLHSVLAVSSRHVLLGWLAEPSQLPHPIIDNRATLATIADSQLFEAVDLGGAFRGQQALSFDAALDQAQHWWSSYEREDMFLLDVRAAHRRISPLPTIRWEGDTRVVVVERKEPGRRRHPVSAAAEDHSPTEQGAEPDESSAPLRIERWRRSLLDLSYRNPLLRLSASASVPLHVPAGALDLLVELISGGTRLSIDEHANIDDLHRAQGARTAADVEPGALTQILEHEQRIFAVLGFTEFLRRLRSLQRRARTTAEETGADPLYIATGLLTWDEVGPRGGRNAHGRAPLFLVPVTLTGGRGRTPFRVSIDETRETVANISLVEKLRAEQGITLAPLLDPPTYEGRVDVLSAAEQLRRLLLKEGMENFAVEESAHLALAQFSTLDLWRDLSENWRHFMTRPVIGHLVERPGEPYRDATAAPEPDPMAETTMRLPLPADGSQLQAVRWAAAGKSFILEGPPGTGKSQTIANLIAECLHRGKKVLFVAEKQAALDVVQRRLDEVGLGPFTLDVHGRKQSLPMVRDQIRQSLEATETGPVAWDAVTSRATASAGRLARYRDQLHSPGPTGLSTWQAHQLRLELTALEDDDAAPDLAVDRDAVARLDDLDQVYREAADLDRAVLDLDCSPAEHPWSLARLAPDDGADFDREAIAAAVTELLAAEAALPDSPAAQLLSVALTGEQVGAAAAWLGALVPGFGESALKLDTADFAHRAQQIDDRLWPFGKNRRRDRLLDEMEEHITQRSAIDRDRLADSLAALDALRHSWGALREAFSADPERQRQAGKLASSIFNNGHPAQVPLAEAQQLSAAWERLTGLLDVDQMSLQRWAQGITGVSAAEPPGRAAAVAACAPAWSRDAGDSALIGLGRWCAVSRHLESLHAQGLGHAAEAVAAGQIPAGEAQPTLRRSLARAALEERLHTTGLHRFDQVHHRRRIDQFSSTSAQRRDLLRQQLPAELLGSRSFAPGSEVGAVGQLRQQLSRRRGGLRIRQLFERYGELITEAAPCLLMSPDSVARFLPAEAVDFDVVVFDEASQIQVPEAIGAMGRGRSVVIVGDTKQMPPTTTFSHSGTEEEGDDAGLVPVDLDSILSEAHESGLPRLWLTWHYRSKDEKLIAFSNEQYYNGRLSTFPAPPGSGGGAEALQLRVVDGTWEGGRGADRVNRTEAREVAAEIAGLLRQDPGRSIGVVTFNVQQRDLLLDMLEADPDPMVQEALARDQEPLFVKNLENVQGDERDVIIFTLAFSRDESGRVPLQWGSMTSSGGERRLNVAITRARQAVRILSSFQPHELDLRNSTSQGLADLKEYLLSVRQSSAPALREGLTGSPARTGPPEHPEDPHAASVRARLEAAGLEVIPQLGLSGFHVDFAVRAADRPWIAVLLDGPEWAARRTVGDRDALPAAVLTGAMGWPAVERIWLPEWLRDPQDAVTRIRTAAETADHPSAEPEASAAPIEDGRRRSPASGFGAETQHGEAGQGSGGDSTPSGPAPIAVTQRHVEEVPYAELREVMLNVLRRAFRAPEDELLRSVARLYGHQRMGTRIQGRLDEVFQQVVAEGAITATDTGEYQPGTTA